MSNHNGRSPAQLHLQKLHDAKTSSSGESDGREEIFWGVLVMVGIGA